MKGDGTDNSVVTVPNELQVSTVSRAIFTTHVNKRRKRQNRRNRIVICTLRVPLISVISVSLPPM